MAFGVVLARLEICATRVQDAVDVEISMTYQVGDTEIQGAVQRERWREGCLEQLHVNDEDTIGAIPDLRFSGHCSGGTLEAWVSSTSWGLEHHVVRTVSSESDEIVDAHRWEFMGEPWDAFGSPEYTCVWSFEADRPQNVECRDRQGPMEAWEFEWSRSGVLVTGFTRMPLGRLKTRVTYGYGALGEIRWQHRVAVFVAERTPEQEVQGRNDETSGEVWKFEYE
jgi:hypothetical protein